MTRFVGEILWDKQSDSFITEISNFKKSPSKRNILQKFASIHDPLGFIYLYVLTAKLIQRNVCD